MNKKTRGLKLREKETSITKRIHYSKGKKYFGYWIYVPKEVITDSLLEDFLKKFENKTKVKVRIRIAKNETIKIKGLALITFLGDKND